jgi:hypothetical protein
MVRQWKAGNFVLELSGEVPDFDFAGKVALRHDVGIWMLDANDEQMLAVGRGIDTGEDSRFADPACAVDVNACADWPEVADMREADTRQLRRGVVVEQVFIMRVFEQVFIGAYRSFLSVAFLNDGAIRGFGFRWRISTGCGDGLDKQDFAVGHPLHRIAHDSADPEAFKLLGLGGLNVADPQLDAVGDRVGKSEFGAVGRPVRQVEVRIGGKAGDLARLARRDLNQTQGDKARRVVSPVGRRVDAQAGQPQHGLGEIGDRRIPKALNGEQPFAVWTQLD